MSEVARWFPGPVDLVPMGRDGGYDGTAPWNERPGSAVDPGRLAELDGAYAEPPEYRTAEAVLRREHVLILQGPARSGRTTTALRLLHRVGATTLHRVHDLSRLAVGAGARVGWLVDDPPRGDLAGIDAHLLRGWADRLRAAGGYLVVTAGDEVVLGADVAEVVAPCSGDADAELVLERGLRGTFPGGLLPRRVARLVEQDWVQGFLDARPLPGDVGHLVAILVAVGGGKLDPDEAERHFVGQLAAETATWFQRQPDARERCFLIAAAVLQDFGFERVDDAARVLEEEFAATGAAVEHPWRAVSPRERRLRAVGGHLYDVERQTAWGVVPMRVVRFAHPWLATALLQHVWEHHDDARRPLVAWLDRLVRADDADPAVAWRAATTLGSLAREDLAWLLARVVRPWARTGRPATRDAAAVALAAVAADPARADQVLRLLHALVTEDPHARMAAVAAVAYGFVHGELAVEQALTDLPVVLAASPGRAATVAQAVGRLCAGPQAALVLRRLVAWTGDAALDLTVRLLAMEGQEGPLLLDLALRDPALREPVVRLWGHAWGRPAAEDALHAWLVAAERRRSGEEVLDAVVEHLSHGPGRPALLAATTRWAADPAGPPLATTYRDRLTPRLDLSTLLAAILRLVRH